jgi:hypothetical protein
MICIAARTITPAARQWLARTTHARLLSIFEHTCNIVNKNGAVITLSRQHTPLAPFALQIAAVDFHGLQAADGAQVVGSELYLGQWRIQTANARVWNPVPDWASVRRAVTTDPDVLTLLNRQALTICPSGSLLELYCTPASSAALQQTALGAANLVNGVRTHTLDQAIDGARQLAGLGPGLTPSGDDFIIGVMLAAWAGLYGAAAKEFCVALAHAAAPRTTSLSAAFLHAAARGEAMSPWHTLFAALACPDALAAALRTVLAVGHTSGADALAGFIASCYWKDIGVSFHRKADKRWNRETEAASLANFSRAS